MWTLFRFEAAQNQVSQQGHGNRDIKVMLSTIKAPQQAHHSSRNITTGQKTKPDVRTQRQTKMDMPKITKRFDMQWDNNVSKTKDAKHHNRIERKTHIKLP